MNTIGTKRNCSHDKLYCETLGAVLRLEKGSNRFSVKRSSDLPQFLENVLWRLQGGGELVPGKKFCYFSYLCKDCKFVGFGVASSNPHTQVDV